MLVQLNRSPEPRDFSITAIGLPLNPTYLPQRRRGPSPSVAVLGHRSRVAGLAQHLPGEWSVREIAMLDDVAPGEFLLLAGTNVREVQLARSVLPARTPVVALVDDTAEPEVVAGVLTAGADVCVRGGEPAILASHLVACRRRQLANRWARMDADKERV